MSSSSSSFSSLVLLWTVVAWTLFGLSRGLVFRDDLLGPAMPNLFIGGTSRFSKISSDGAVRAKKGSSPFGPSRLKDGRDWPGIWADTGTVPEVLPEAPPNPLFVSMQSRIQIRPNDTITSGLTLQEPEVLSWDADPAAFHALVLTDVDAALSEAPEYIHYLVINIPGNKVSSGEVVAPYQPSFALNVDLEEGRVMEDPAASHRYLWLVYRQAENARIEMAPSPDICSEEGFEFRMQTLQDLVEDYDLGPLVAGNFHRSGFSGETTRKFVCTMSRCFGRPWPMSLPGFNDSPECQDDVQSAEQPLEEEEV